MTEQQDQTGADQANPGQARTGQPSDTRVDTGHLRDYTDYRRSRGDRRIAGVAGGLGRHLNIDPTIVRVAFVVLAFFGGAGILLYGAAWLFVPDDSGAPARIQLSAASRNVLLIIVGAIAALLAVGDSWGGWGPPWWLALVALVVFALLMARDNRPRPQAGPPVFPPPHSSKTTTPPPQAGYGPAYGQPVYAPTTYPAPVAPTGDGAESTAAYPWQPVPPVSYEPPTPSKAELRRQRGPILFGFTVALLAAGLGALGLYEASGHHVADAAYPALAIALIGGMLVVGAFYGRPGGLVLLGLIATVALGITAVVEPRFDGDRDLVVRPASAADLDSSYFVPAGQLILDLRDLDDPSAVTGKDLELRGNAGHIKVLLPHDLGANVDARLSLAGDIRIDGEDLDNGFGANVNTRIGSTGSGDPHVNLDIRLGAGFVEIERKEAA
ncbi:MAG: PspC domain-containing protein [Nocardioidaceae bacterium]